MKHLFKLWSSLLLATLTGIAALSTMVGCDSRAHEPDLEKEQWIFLLATIPKETDLQEICLNDQNTALACIQDTGVAGGQAIYISTMESVYTITVPSPRDANALCSVLTTAPTYPDPTASPDTTYTTGAKACFFNCDQDYWKRMREGGFCTASNFSTLSPSTDETYKGCLTVCLTRGTLLPQ